ncbi:hypothetical protein D3C75_810050 [compost metagenome]
MLGLIIHQQRAGAVAAQYTESFEREAIEIAGLDVIAVKLNHDRGGCCLPGVFDHSLDPALGNGEPA